MRKLIADSAESLAELILFTGNSSTIPERLYLRVGFEGKAPDTMAIIAAFD